MRSKVMPICHDDVHQIPAPMINSLWPRNAIWRQWSGSSLVQRMARRWPFHTGLIFVETGSSLVQVMDCRLWRQAITRTNVDLLFGKSQLKYTYSQLENAFQNVVCMTVPHLVLKLCTIPSSAASKNIAVVCINFVNVLQYIPRNMHTVFALLCFVVVIHWLIFPYLSGLLHWHCGNLTIAPVPAKQPWWIWINTSCEFIMNDCITTTKQSTTKPCAYFLGYTVLTGPKKIWRNLLKYVTRQHDIIWTRIVQSLICNVASKGTKDYFLVCHL